MYFEFLYPFVMVLSLFLIILANYLRHLKRIHLEKALTDRLHALNDEALNREMKKTAHILKNEVYTSMKFNELFTVIFLIVSCFIMFNFAQSICNYNTYTKQYYRASTKGLAYYK